MKCNIRELAQLSDHPCAIEGRLNYKKVSNGSYRNPAVFKERWFRLINNYLFYFKISEMGKFDTKNPAGAFVMENSSIQMEHGQSIPFSFSISFIDEPEKRHVFAARAEDNVIHWVIKLRECSYEYLRSRLYTLQSKIYSITGKDPLLLVPRNEGACLWAPSIPFSTTPACTVNTSSFSCHLHTNGGFSLERSKSDVQAHKHIRTQLSNKTTFYTDDINSSSHELKQSSNHMQSSNLVHSSNFVHSSNHVQSSNLVHSSSLVHSSNHVQSSNHVFALGRSKTSALLPDSASLVNNSIFDNRPLYSRAAPSPPVRQKLSPGVRRSNNTDDAKQLVEQGKLLGTSGILDAVPVPPKRKSSPKYLEFYDAETGDDDSKNNQSSDDLIQF